MAELVLDLNSDSTADTEIAGLLALMLLQESRRAARSAAQGELVLMVDQDRRLWNRDFIEKGWPWCAAHLAMVAMAPILFRPL